MNVNLEDVVLTFDGKILGEIQDVSVKLDSSSATNSKFNYSKSYSGEFTIENVNEDSVVGSIFKLKQTHDDITEYLNKNIGKWERLSLTNKLKKIEREYISLKGE